MTEQEEMPWALNLQLDLLLAVDQWVKQLLGVLLVLRLLKGTLSKVALYLYPDLLLVLKLLLLVLAG